MKKLLILILSLIALNSFGQNNTAKWFYFQPYDTTQNLFTIKNGIAYYNQATNKYVFYQNGAYKHLGGSGGGGLSTTLSAGHIYVGNVSNVATDVAVSGGATLSSSGVLTLSASQTGITTLGTITAGVWNGTALTPFYGGLGGASGTTSGGDLIVGNAGDWQRVAIGTANQVLKVNAGTPQWGAPFTITTTGTSGAATFTPSTGVLNVPQYSGTTYAAGTGLTLSTNTFSVNTSQNISTLSNLSTNGFVKTSGGIGTLGVSTSVNLATDVTGTLPNANGGYLFTEVGSLFTESWANLSQWANVGSPSASVAGGQLTLAGTASSSNNYIRCSGYGNTAVEKGYFTWTETVGTISASSSGIAFGLQNQSGYSAGSIMVNLELSTTGTGTIKWFLNNNASPGQTSTVSISPVITNVLNFKFVILPEGFRLEVSVNGSTTPISDKYLYNFNPGFTGLVPNAAQFCFFNLGQGATPHTVGALTYYCNQNQSSDLWIGDSITEGYGVTSYPTNRWISILQKNYNVNVETLSKQGNQITDVNTVEVGKFNPKNVILFIGTNDLQNVSAATARTRLSTLVTSLGALVTTNAPSGYTTGNGNLKFMTALPRTLVTTFNANMQTDYGIANLIDTYNALYTGVTTALKQPTFSYDGTHPNDQACEIIADVVSSALGYVKARTYSANDFKLSFTKGNASTGSWNAILPEGDFSVNKPAANTSIVGQGAYWTGGGFIPTQTSAVLYGMATTGIFSVYADASLTVGTAYSTHEWFRVTNNGAVNVVSKQYIGNVSTTPTALLHLAAGTASANTGPLKFTSGIFTTTPETGLMEYDGINLAFTPSGTTTRKIASLNQVVRATSQVAANASVATWTVGANDGSFDISANVLVTASTTHSFTVTCTYTDEGNTSRTLTLNLSQLTGTFITTITNVTGASAYEGVPVHIRCKAGTTITIGTTGTFTSVTYNVEGRITQTN